MSWTSSASSDSRSCDPTTVSESLANAASSPRAPEGSRREAGVPLEGGGQPALRSEAAFDGDVRKWPSGFGDETPCASNAAIFHDAARVPPCRSLEGAGEVVGAERRAGGQIVQV